jgi:hypothetical protein
VQSIDQGIEILTGLTAGERNDKGEYPPDSVNGMVQKRLQELSEKREQFGAGKEQGGQS